MGDYSLMAKLGWLQPTPAQDHKVISTRDLRQNLAEVITYTASRKAPVILTRNGTEQAAIISMPEVLLLDFLDQKIPLRRIIQEFELDGYNFEKAWEKLKEQINQQASKEADERATSESAADGIEMPD